MAGFVGCALTTVAERDATMRSDKTAGKKRIWNAVALLVTASLTARKRAALQRLRLL